MIFGSCNLKEFSTITSSVNPYAYRATINKYGISIEDRMQGSLVFICPEAGFDVQAIFIWICQVIVEKCRSFAGRKVYSAPAKGLSCSTKFTPEEFIYLTMIKYETSLKIYFVLLAAEAAQNFTNRKQLHSVMNLSSTHKTLCFGMLVTRMVAFRFCLFVRLILSRSRHLTERRAILSCQV